MIIRLILHVLSQRQMKNNTAYLSIEHQFHAKFLYDHFFCALYIFINKVIDKRLMARCISLASKLPFHNLLDMIYLTHYLIIHLTSDYV